MDASVYAQVLIETWAAFMALVMFFITRSVMRKNNPKRNDIILMNLFTFVLLVADALAYVYQGSPSKLAYYMVRISNFTVFSMNHLLIATISRLLSVNLKENGSRRRPYWFYCGMVLLALDMCQLIVNIFTRHLYSFDADNLYHRESLYSIFIVIQLLVMLMDLIVVAIYRKLLTKKEIMSYVSFILFPILATVWILFNYGISLSNIAVFTSLLLIVFLMALDDTEKLSKMHEKIITDFAGMVEAREEGTGIHVRKEAIYVEAIGNQMIKKGIYYKKMKPDLVEKMAKAAPLHDMGKIAISDAILNKPSKLTDEEFATVKKHTTEGMKLLSKTILSVGGGGYMEDALDMAWSHHERWDGTGYPQGLKGEDIPVTARVMAVADTFDALISNRPYRKAYSFDEAVSIIKEESGTHFDPMIVDCFLDIADEFREEV